MVEIPFMQRRAISVYADLQKYAGTGFAALVIAQPNFFGVIEEADELTNWAHQQGCLSNC